MQNAKLNLKVQTLRNNIRILSSFAGSNGAMCRRHEGICAPLLPKKQVNIIIITIVKKYRQLFVKLQDTAKNQCPASNEMCPAMRAAIIHCLFNSPRNFQKIKQL